MQDASTEKLKLEAWREEFFRKYEELNKTDVFDNIDKFRFPNLKGDIFTSAMLNINYDIFFKNIEYAFNSRELLNDELSRSIFDAVLLFHICGNRHVKLPTYDRFRQAEAVIDSLNVSSQSKRSLLFPDLKEFNIEKWGREFSVVAWPGNILQTFLMEQYFVERGGVSIRPNEGDTVIDGGACFGDTALAFAHHVGDNGRVFAFEMMPAHIDVITANLALNPDLARRIDVVPFALNDGSSSEPSKFSTEVEANDKLNPGARFDSSRMKCITVDDFVRNNNIDRIDFLKLDIEGYEANAIAGARDTIRAFRPTLAISVYHSMFDLMFMPLLVRNIEAEYDFILDHYTIHAEETVLFAVPRAKSHGLVASSEKAPDPASAETVSVQFWKEKFKNAERERDSYMAEVGRIQSGAAWQLQQTANWTAAHAAASLEIAGLKGNLRAITNDRDWHAQQALNWQGALDAASQESEGLRDNLRAMTNDRDWHAQQALNWQGALDAASQESEGLRDNLRAMTNDRDWHAQQALNWQGALDAASQESEGLRDNLRAMTNDRDWHAQQALNWQGALDAASQESEGLRDNLRAMTNDRDWHAQQALNWQGALDAASQESEGLRDNLRAMTNDRDWHAQQALNWQGALDAASQESEGLRDNLRAMTNDRDWHAQQALNWQGALDAASQESEGLRDNLRAMTNDRDWHAQQALNWTEAHALAADQIAVLTERLTNAETERDSSVREMAELRRELDRAWRQMALLKSRLTEIENWRGFWLLARLHQSESRD